MYLAISSTSQYPSPRNILHLAISLTSQYPPPCNILHLEISSTSQYPPPRNILHLAIPSDLAISSTSQYPPPRNESPPRNTPPRLVMSTLTSLYLPPPPSQVQLSPVLFRNQHDSVGSVRCMSPFSLTSFSSISLSNTSSNKPI
ncbi:hypothetical protein DPMN_021238 [Dreissena polymorpha]|uniref:Uncharacterized protein n=1 Tax=Dreissena polymorpha TaxID=45954 RepID=A0A9D4NNF6_DREPO|nr:hypothetical protein DPMN_021238 [Dreissena polymorpha]